MKSLQLVYKKILYFFVSYLKIINENSQINVVNTLTKDQCGNTVVHVSPSGAEKQYPIYPHQILENKNFIKQFSKADLRLIKCIVVAEGDIFIANKEFEPDQLLFDLYSVISKERWKLSLIEIAENLDILNRVNKRFLKKIEELRSVYYNAK